jgi:hypothetical protein
MIPKSMFLDADRGWYRFSGKIMRKKATGWSNRSRALM